MVSGSRNWRLSKRVRKFGLAVSAILLAVGLSVGALVSANSTTNASGSNIDYAASFNGNNNFYVSGLTVIPANGNFSAGLWINETSGTSGCRDVFAVGNTSEFNQRFSIRLGDYSGVRRVEVFVRGGQAFTSAGSFAQGQWVHVAVTHSAGQNFKLYINGKLDSTFSTTNTTAHSYGNVAVGQNYFDGACKFIGQIDELKTWSVERSASEVETDMHARTAKGSSGLMYYWDFNEGGTGASYDFNSNQVLNAQGSGGVPRVDVKEISTIAGGDTVLVFKRTYLPGVGGWQSSE